MKKIIIGLPAFFAATFLAVTFAHAATADNANDSGSVVPALVPVAAAASAPAVVPVVDTCASVSPADIAQLSAIQNDPTLSASDELSQELALRKKMLGATITCAIQDAQLLRNELASSSVPDASSDAAFVRNQLLGKVDDAITFYAIESSKLDGAGINATQAIAREMLAWRAVNYDALAGNVNNYALWLKNQALFATAANRLAQTKRVVSFIEDASSPNSDLDSALQDAQTALADAESANASAGSAIAQLQSPESTLGLIRGSLQSLADAYQKFSDLNGFIQKLLPTSG